MSIDFHLPNFVDRFGSAINLTVIDMVKKLPEMFYDDIKIASVFDSFPLIWNGGRMMIGYMDENTVKNTVPRYLYPFNAAGVPCRFTFTNPMLTEKDIADPACNAVLDIADNGLNEVIVFSPLLEKHIRETHPDIKITSSTCKQIRSVQELEAELDKDYKLVVLDYNFNNDLEKLEKISKKEKCELLVNAVCTPNCPRRGDHYRYIGKYQLEHCNAAAMEKFRNGTAKLEEWNCSAMKTNVFARRRSPLNISPQDIFERYVPMGFTNFKLEGRGTSFADLIEQYVYYLVKPQYRPIVQYNLTSTAAKVAGSGRMG